MSSPPSSPSHPSSSSSSSSSEHQPVTQTQLNSLMQNFAAHQTQQMQQQNQEFQQQIQEILHAINHNSSAASAAAATAQPSNPIYQPGPSSASNNLPQKVKIATPSNVYGKNDMNVDSWLFEMTQYLDTCGVADRDRTNVARTYLKNTALQWWVTQNQPPNSSRLSTWPAFATAIRLRFQPVAASRAARTQLRSFSQDKLSLADYVSKFYALLNLIPDMAEADQIDYFINGLRTGLQKDVLIQDPPTLQDAMIKAQKIDSLLQTHKINYKPFSSSPSPSSAFEFHPYSAPSSSSFSSSSSSSAPSAMELGNVNISAETEASEPADDPDVDREYEHYLELGEDYEPAVSETTAENEVEEKEISQQLQAMQARSTNSGRVYLSREEFTRCRNEGLCLRCKRPGHVARNCPLPPRPSSNQYRNNPSQYHPNPNSQSQIRRNNPTRRNF